MKPSFVVSKASTLTTALFFLSIGLFIGIKIQFGWTTKRKPSNHHNHRKSKKNYDSVVQIESEFISNEVDPVVEKIEQHIRYKSIVIGVAGGSGSGKTTLSKAIVETLGRDNITYISHDSYYRDISHLTLKERELQNFDHPDSLDTSLLLEHVKQLKNKLPVEIPIYDFTTHSRKTSTKELIYPRPIILIVGILIFSDTCKELYDEFDIKIFVDTDDDIRFIRRIQRDTIERGRTSEQIIEQYLRTVRPMHHQYVQPSKRNADIIVPFGLNSVALDLVISKLKRVLNEAETIQTQTRNSDEIETENLINEIEL